MSENSQMTDQIFTDIDKIGVVLESNVDLSQDVAPFMTSTLAKIKQLALAKDGDYEAQYELFQIATNYLPLTINSYCSLPIEYRNTRIVKENKTARQLLIENLKLFKKQVLELEKQFYSAIENQIKVESSFVHQKYASQIELATQLDNIGEDGFVNQFDFSQYKDSPHYKDITFKRELSQDEIQAKERAEKNNQRIAYVGSKAQELGSFLIDSTKNIFTVIGKGTKVFLGGIIEASIFLIAPVFIVGVIGIFIAAIHFGFRDNAMRDSVVEASQQIHSVMSVNIIEPSEFANFVNTKTTELIGSDYRKENIKITYDTKKQTMSMQVSDFDKDLCVDLIDEKENKFDATTVLINGMPLPQDNTISEYRIFKNENHTLCHLKEGNKVTLNFDNQAIYNFAKGNILLTNSEKNTKIANLEKELAQFEAISKEPHNLKYSEYYKERTDKIQDALNKMKAAKTIDK